MSKNPFETSGESPVERFKKNELLINGFVNYLSQIPGSMLDMAAEPILERFDDLCNLAQEDGVDLEGISVKLENILEELRQTAEAQGITRDAFSDEKLITYHQGFIANQATIKELEIFANESGGDRLTALEIQESERKPEEK